MQESQHDICCVGHITLDKVVTTKKVVHMPGGTSFYFSNAIRNMEDIDFTLVTALGEREMYIASTLRNKGIDVKVLPSAHTVYFENIYSENQDHRTQRVTQKADAFTAAQLADVNAKIFHLGPLLADDMPASLIKDLSRRGQVCLDVQGFLRKVEDEAVKPVDWSQKNEALQYIDILKANESEMAVLTGVTNIHKGAVMLSEWGVKEVIITLGSKGSVIYSEGNFYYIPAFIPETVTDATGCGDTYMAGYLSQRVKGADLQSSGEFAAAMATLKIESSGPFTGTREDVQNIVANRERAVIALTDALFA